MRLSFRKKIIKLDTLGCKLNQAETGLLAEQFTQLGFKLTSSIDEADIYILNTCTVTHLADRKSRHLLRLARRRNSEVVVVAIGCYGQRSYDELIDIDGVNMVLGNDEKMKLPKLLEMENYVRISNFNEKKVKTDQKNCTRSRAFIMIQDGCDKFCSYCIVPFVRRVKRCIPPDEIVSRVKKCVADDYKEVVLTGTEIGDYEWGGFNLNKLIEKILRRTKIERLRLSSLQPHHISRELTSQWQDNRLCSHFHLALQSGSDTVLRRMKRQYDKSGFEKAVEKIRDVSLDAAITTDIIVGFPGETEDEFEDSFQFCKRMDFARIHVFPFSKRSQTAAAEMNQQVKNRVKRVRRDKMLKLSEDSSIIFREKCYGKKEKVLWEDKKNGYCSGFSSNYIRVYSNSGDLTNSITDVVLGELWKEGMKPKE
jgi:threonylcarbamoyladenosine tRNA methylthiotransferase MtaB